MPMIPGDWIDCGHGPCIISQIEAQQDRDGRSVNIQCAWTPHMDLTSAVSPPSMNVVMVKLGDTLEIGGVAFILRFIKHQFRRDESGRQLRSMNLWGCDVLMAQVKDDEHERQSWRFKEIDRHIREEHEEP